MLFIATWMQGRALSGGDRILIELARSWRNRGLRVDVATSTEGCRMMERYAVPATFCWVSDRFTGHYVVDYLYRTFKSVLKAVGSPANDLVYSASDFWPDMFPALIRKLTGRSRRWAAGFYLFAEPPTKRWFHKKTRSSSSPVAYYLTQSISYFLVRRFADIVLVTSVVDPPSFSGQRVVVVKGGVNVPSVPIDAADYEAATYDAVFIGRLHPQKGVMDLVDIWASVVRERPDAKLVVIGDGQLKEALQQAMDVAGLQHSVSLVGFKDGAEKEQIFKQSRVVLHPATYDTGGMAAAEAMAFGLPGVAYDLPALRPYYPVGMLKVPPRDTKAFATAILSLLTNRALYVKLSGDARDHMVREWSWERRASEILQQVGADGAP